MCVHTEPKGPGRTGPQWLTVVSTQQCTESAASLLLTLWCFLGSFALRSISTPSPCHLPPPFTLWGLSPAGCISQALSLASPLLDSLIRGLHEFWKAGGREKACFPHFGLFPAGSAFPLVLALSQKVHDVPSGSPPGWYPPLPPYPQVWGGSGFLLELVSVSSHSLLLVSQLPHCLSNQFPEFDSLWFQYKVVSVYQVGPDQFPSDCHITCLQICKMG